MTHFRLLRASLVAQIVKNMSAMQETWVQSLGWIEPLEEGMSTPSNIPAWTIPWTEKPGRLQSWSRKESDTTEWLSTDFWRASQVVLVVKNPLANAGDIRDVGSIPGSGRSPGEGMATHSSTLAWTAEPGAIWFAGSQRIRHDWSYLAHRLLKYFSRILFSFWGVRGG